MDSQNGNLSNFQKWQVYNSGLTSPQSYVDWGFYAMIAMCLQRRVWLGPAHQRLYPNMFTILCGPPGVGKGLVLKEVNGFVRSWKLADAMKWFSKDAKTSEDKSLIEMMVQSDLEKATKNEFQGTSGKQNKDVVPPGLFHVAADSTTYQALIDAIGECYRSISHYVYDEKQQKEILVPYRHSSTCFILPELSSLLRQKSEDTVNFLLGLYDCPDDYEYRTISRQKDRVRRGCVNLIAGTTPSYMQSTFDFKITDEGFSSRTFYVCANHNRKNQFFMPAHNEVQIGYKRDLLEHLINLSQLCGPIQIEPQTYEYLESWWDRFESDKTQRINKSPKLQAYYARRQIHTTKIAMAMHFGETTSMKIPLQRFIDADEFLRREEKSMHLALVLGGHSPMSRASKYVLDLLQGGRKKRVEIYIELHSMLGSKVLIEECLDFLTETDQITTESVKDEKTDRSDLYYKLK
jgi:Protein of unknown function (DUF3987)